MRARGATLGVLVALVCTLASAGCSSGSGSAAARPSRASRTHLDWVQCDAIECARLIVPLDPAQPQGATIELALYRRRARDRRHRIGSLLVNPGGPGISARPLVADAPDVLPRGVTDRFDVVGWDPRGVGASSSLRCGEHLDAFFALDWSPDEPSEEAALVAASTQLGAECQRASPQLIGHLGTAETVADIERIRTALHETHLNFLGFSYGTFIGTVYALRHPDRVRTMVLDGAVDSSLDAATTGRQQAQGFERSLDAFLVDCSRRSSCAFHSSGHAARAFDELFAQIDAESIYAKVRGETRDLDQTEAMIGVVSLLYDGRAAWPVLARALRDSATGDGSALLRASDDYTMRVGRDTYTPAQAAFYAIGCLDGQQIGSLAALRSAATETRRVAPRVGALSTWLGLPCVSWPAHPTLRASNTAARAPSALPPVLVLSTTDDPATPYAWGQGLARQLHGQLITVAGDAHTALGSGSACAARIASQYFLTAKVPARSSCP